MTDQPITPTRIIPAGQPLPQAPPFPQAPHGATDLPPWRTAAPPPRPPAGPPAVPPPPPPWAPPPASGPIEVRVTVDLVAPQPEPEPEGKDWSWLTSRIRPWASLISAVVVLGPWFGGRSIVSGWSMTTHAARTEAGILPAYIIAGGALALMVLADSRRPRWWTRGALMVALIGGTGAMAWFDPVQFLTGVRP
ncbi:hypothetical protein ACIGW8_22145 [Streptomyces sioyaensis]|uniref:hypothetical protein n=1 Tax=Streptomyces sioyaensis TaxID=67364 RepID=UPI0037D395E3